MQELPPDQGVAGGHDRGGRPSEPGGQPQAGCILQPVQGQQTCPPAAAI